MGTSSQGVVYLKKEVMLDHLKELVEREFSGAQLPDERFRSNLYKMASSLIEHPEVSFSSACGELVRKSASRLFSSTEVDLGSGHAEATRQRCESEKIVLVAEDTTDLNYWNHKSTQGLGLLGGQKTVLGLAVHSALALTESGEPLGVVGEHIWAPTTDGQNRGKSHKIDIKEKESYKWLLALGWAKEVFKGFEGKVIMIGDREADLYEHFVTERDKINLLIRSREMRRKIYLVDPQASQEAYEELYQKAQKTPKFGSRSASKQAEMIRVKDLADKLPIQGQMEVHLRRQKDREERTAKLEVRFGKIIYPASEGMTGDPQLLWVVHAKEVGCKEGVKPIEWYLFSTLAIETLDDAVRFIGYYAKRWIIERFHYVLKQGLRVERLQFDNFQRLKNALELYLIIAWYLLRLTYLGKACSDKPAPDYFDSFDIKLVQQITSKTIKTVKQYVLALATLAGFKPSKNQPLPGEKLLWQSMRTLLAIRRGVELAQIMGHD
jgi:hypothetical protein